MSRRPRGRGRKPQNNNNKNPNRALDSNGPDVRVRGSAKTIYEKYISLAHDASTSGHRVKAQNYLQHAEHYFRIMKELQAIAEARAEKQQKEYEARQAERAARQQENQAKEAEKAETPSTSEADQNNLQAEKPESKTKTKPAGRTKTYLNRRRKKDMPADKETGESAPDNEDQQNSAADSETADKPKGKKRVKKPEQDDTLADAETAAE